MSTRSLFALSCLALLACGHAKSPANAGASGPDLAPPLAEALKEEAIGDPDKARGLYEDVLAKAAATPDAPHARDAVDASIDALVLRSLSPLRMTTPETALAYRTRAADLAPALERAHAATKDPWMASTIARGLQDLAEHDGDATRAEKWRAARGCAREALVYGPISWTTVTGVTDPSPLDDAVVRLPASMPAPGPFALPLAPAVVRGRGCAIDLVGPSATAGVRAVVVDVDVPRAQRIAVVLRTQGAAEVRVGGRPVIERAFELGASGATQRAWAEVAAGRVRVVAKVGMTESGDQVELDLLDENGQPLATHAPAPGDAVGVRATASGPPVTSPDRATEEDAVAAAAGALAREDAHTAERELHDRAVRPDAAPLVALLYGRAVERADDLSAVGRAERARGAWERALEVWPNAWEPMLAHAVLAGERRGRSEAGIETLRDLDLHRAKATPASAALLDVFDATVSAGERLYDRANAALDRARAPLAGTSLLADAEMAAVPRVGAERVAAACDPRPPHARDRFDCYDALRATGGRADAARELDRLRDVLGSPQRWLGVELRESLVAGDKAKARAAFEAMTPGERTLSTLQAIASGTGELRRDLASLVVVARDAPGGVPAILSDLGEDPLRAFEGRAEALASEDRARPILEGAATAVLAHEEAYDLDASGLLHATLFDVRRVSGTTDVEENAAAQPPGLFGRPTLRALRRRIFKADGRVLEPDRSPTASQAHAELAQLEKGDVVEAIYESWMLPGETGDVVVDTPDLLPERTAVHSARIRFTLPTSLTEAKLWSHAILGKPDERVENGKRTLVWSLTDRRERRLEEGVPRMDRSVGVSFATARWSEVARGLRETLASLDEHDPEIGAWAREAAKGKPPRTKAMIAAVVEAAGKTVREADPSALSDFGVGRTTGAQSMTARTILTQHQGSRSWLVVRALRELGVPAEVAIAEDVPFSADPNFPPHFGRFTHPLVVAHALDGDEWIDADVIGPPLPAGRISPALRGRMMIDLRGVISPVPRVDDATGDRDEIDVRLALDDKGDAHGTVSIVLRGRDAQMIAEVLNFIVGSDRQRALREIVLAWVPFASVDEVALSSSEGSWQIAVRASLTASGYAQEESGGVWSLPGIDPLHAVFPRARVAELGATYASLASRENALAINDAVQYHVHRRIEIPKGWSVSRMPGPFQVNDAHLGASRRIGTSAGIVEDDFVLTVPTGTVPAAEYGTFVSDAHQTDDAFLAATWIRASP